MKKVTNCPNCGAPIDISRSSCEYCGTPYPERRTNTLYADNQPVLSVYECECIRQALNAYPAKRSSYDHITELQEAEKQHLEYQQKFLSLTLPMIFSLLATIVIPFIIQWIIN